MTLRSKIRNRLFAFFMAAPMLVLPVSQAHAGVFISVGFAPPVLPVYAQPPLPAPGYIWTPGYWAYGDAGYYWVPGVWVHPPRVGVLWTPGYWGFTGGFYAWHPGYWGPHVGFYGGVNYGFGYGGVGFAAVSGAAASSPITEPWQTLAAFALPVCTRIAPSSSATP